MSASASASAVPSASAKPPVDWDNKAKPVTPDPDLEEKAKALLEAALPVPEQAVMHDWWLALHAGFLGRLRPMPERFVSYRQHGANVIGAKSYRAGLNPLQNWRRTWRRASEPSRPSSAATFS